MLLPPPYTLHEAREVAELQRLAETQHGGLPALDSVRLWRRLERLLAGRLCSAAAAEAAAQAEGRPGTGTATPSSAATPLRGSGGRSPANVLRQRPLSAGRQPVRAGEVVDPRSPAGMTQGNGNTLLGPGGAGHTGCSGGGLLDSTMSLVHRSIAPNATLAMVMDYDWRATRRQAVPSSPRAGSHALSSRAVDRLL